jgi:hypothetical protein
MNENEPTAILRLSAYYLITRRLAELMSAEIPIAAQLSLNQNSSERALGMRIGGRIANDLLKSGAFPELTRGVVNRDAYDGSLLASIWGVFAFRGLRRLSLAVEKENRRRPLPSRERSRWVTRTTISPAKSPTTTSIPKPLCSS